jgi:hypothetical protein
MKGTTIALLVGAGVVLVLVLKSTQNGTGTPSNIIGAGAPSNTLQQAASITNAASGTLQSILGAFGGSASSDATDDGD